MVIYFGKQIESARVGARLVQVECDKCGFDYFYELARIGTGSATAPYGLGTTAATRSSQAQSERDLRGRLIVEAELVPCPQCNWINDELVRGYREGRYRRVGMLAAGVGLFGTIGSLICAWFISIGPAADRGALPSFLFVGPAVFVSSAVAIIVLRNWRRSRIQPNENFPLAPQVPSGSPQAMILDEVTGLLKPAKPHDDSDGAGGDWLDFQVGRHQFQPICCVCLDAATPGAAYKRLVIGLGLEIPRCADCARQSRQDSRRVWSITIAAGMLTGTCVLLAMPLDWVLFWLLFGTCAIVSLALASYVASAMTAPADIRGGDASRGVVKLRFRNPEYRPSVTQGGTAEN